MNHKETFSLPAKQRYPIISARNAVFISQAQKRIRNCVFRGNITCISCLKEDLEQQAHDIKDIKASPYEEILNILPEELRGSSYDICNDKYMTELAKREPKLS